MRPSSVNFGVVDAVVGCTVEQLDDAFGFVAAEVGTVSAKDFLAYKFVVVEFSISQVVPEFGFGWGQVLPGGSGKLLEVFGHGWLKAQRSSYGKFRN